ncbi:MAG TPA: tryptophan 2,3-dioxygenase family protein [Flavitalea sp.]|nr:tryptophan 2,3-dioxygenase family protein [Flavitalea sp.]
MVDYSDYLHLSELLSLQQTESGKHGNPAHDEMLFIITHQAYELWFTQILHEITSVRKIMQSRAMNDNSPELQTVVQRLSRIVTILKVLVHQVEIMETMTPMDFLDFRDLLRPASGFQSWQYKIIEGLLGLKFQHRHAQEYYLKQLKPEYVELIKKAESESTVLGLVNIWLERIPYTDEQRSWEQYQEAYVNSLSEEEKDNSTDFINFFSDSNINDRGLSPKACRAALFIMLYRGYPILQLPFQLLNNLLEIDEQLSTWRYRHMNMVHRMIGTRIGTGGSSGKDYLKSAADKHYIFSDLSKLTSFLIERRKLPQLTPEMERNLGFVAITK